MPNPWRNATLEQAVAGILRLSQRDPVTGCLLYLGHRNQKGYGRVAFAGRYTTAHRVMFMATHGPIDRSVHVLHRCDVTNCCEPTHLVAGDNFSNQRDRVQKGRFTKLIPGDIDRIRDQLACGVPQQHIASHLGVWQSMISRIKTGQRWGHLPAAGGV